MRALSAGLVTATSAASKPMPATTRQACSEPRVGRAQPPGGAGGPVSGLGQGVVRTQARSVGRAEKKTAMSMRASRSPTGSPRLRAARLAVPRGTTPSSTSVPARPAATARTVPSPPTAMTRRAPLATASRAWVAPGSATVVSSQTGPRYPAERRARARRRRKSAVTAGLEGLTMTQARASPSAPAPGCAVGPVHSVADRPMRRGYRRSPAGAGRGGPAATTGRAWSCVRPGRRGPRTRTAGARAGPRRGRDR